MAVRLNIERSAPSRPILVGDAVIRDDKSKLNKTCCLPSVTLRDVIEKGHGSY